MECFTINTFDVTICKRIPVADICANGKKKTR